MASFGCKNMVHTMLASVLISGMIAAPALAQTAQESTATPQTPSNQPVDDSWITTKVKAELLAARDVPGIDINVETTNGVVTLSGTVESQAQMDRAVAAARSVNGVKRVDSTGLTLKADGM